MSRIEWTRPRPGDHDFTSNTVAIILNDHFGGDPIEHTMEWFPAQKYRVITNRNYLVDPAITENIIAPYGVEGTRLFECACLLQHPWHVTEATWAAFPWTNRAVYVPHFLESTRNNVYQRQIVEFTRHPKPTWAELQEWEEDYQIADLVRHHPSGLTNLYLNESRAALLAEGLGAELLAAAKSVLYQRIVALKAPMLDSRGGLDETATDKEVRAARVHSLNATYNAVQHAALDEAMRAEAMRAEAE